MTHQQLLGFGLMRATAQGAGVEKEPLTMRSASLPSGLLEDAAQEGDGVDCARPPGVEGQVGDGFGELVGRHAVVERPAQVRGELIAAIPRHQGSHGDEASVAR
jgi:hypothetical protein